MIRIDAETANGAKALNLNISRICEAALAQAIKEETQPYGIVESQQIVFQADLYYSLHSDGLGLVFTVTNTSDENVILDRVNYQIWVKSDDNREIQSFKGTMLERRAIPKSMAKESFAEILRPSSNLAGILKETVSSDRFAKGLKWIVVADLFVDSKRGVLKGKFEQILDEKGFMPRPRPINVF